LQVWFNLAWIDPLHFKERPELAKLKAKGRNFTSEDKDWLLKQQMEILASIIPAYKKAWDQKAIEISASPFYHPILPLLCDTQTARECMPGAPLPERFSYPGDAKAQIVSGLDYMEKLFGRRPNGMWPSEGSVSEKTVELIQQAGVKWMASDEKIWEQSLGKAGRNREDPGEAGQFYRSHIWEQAAKTRLFFRDQQLSDLIGFAYYGWDGQAAARDLVGRLEKKADAFGSKAADHIVPVILDGENAWEAFPADGQIFLDQLYQQLSQNPKLNCCTFSQYLEQNPEPGKMSRIFPGSWINRDFSIWIGQEEDNRAWNLLLAARQAIEHKKESIDPAVMPEITRELHIAEGSDWCWWYGGNFSSENLEDFDILFRSHLQRIYQLLNIDAPRELFSPVSLGKNVDVLINQPIDFIAPKIDGRVSDFYEWAGAGTHNIRQDGGTMHRGQSLLEVVHFGFDQENLYLRLDPHEKTDVNEILDLTINLEFLDQWAKTIPVKLNAPENEAGVKSVFGKIIEIKLPFTAIGAGPGDTISFYVAIVQNSLTVERHPIRSPIILKVPDVEFGAQNWGA
ncbi:MAG: glycoside hydrolase family 57 protein, partial [bacterium]|nr:glycoside hydrolase family 57 protein [bacterium]